MRQHISKATNGALWDFWILCRQFIWQMLSSLPENFEATSDCINGFSIRRKRFEIIALNVRFNPLN